MIHSLSYSLLHSSKPRPQAVEEGGREVIRAAHAKVTMLRNPWAHKSGKLLMCTQYMSVHRQSITLHSWARACGKLLMCACECTARALLRILGQVVSRQLPVELLHAVHDVELIIGQLITILVLAVGLQGKGYHRQPLASTNQVKVPCSTTIGPS